MRPPTPTARPLVLTPLPGEGDLGLVDSLAQLTFAVQGALAKVAATYELSSAQARLLGILRDRRPTITELARFLQLDKTSVTKLVDRAAERGLVRREPSPLDGRSVRVRITATGKRVIGRAVVAFDAEIAQLVTELSDPQRSALSAIATLVVAADARRRGFDVFAVEADVRPGSSPPPPPVQGPGSTNRSR
jgi:MarR family transcriptional regulator, lower aerobic nicotinate degradation pathway regulator